MYFIDIISSPLFMTLTVPVPAFILYNVSKLKRESLRFKRWETILALWLLVLITLQFFWG